jgi:cytochrome c biogenesis protein CcmG/thiol:disulfide interchange protein DsbE
VVKSFGGRARFVAENYGDSQLAKRFGVTRYPAVFVDDVLAATPKDFGFYGRGEGAGDGRYTPFPGAAGEQRFRADLTRIVSLVLAGRKDEARAAAPAPPTAEAQASGSAAPAELPDLTITALDGRRLARRDLLGRVVLVDLWATWCPPCRAALPWIGDLQKAHAGRLQVIAVAVQSDDSEVRKLAAGLRQPILWTMATPTLVRGLGDVSAVPTLLLFDRQGHRAASFYGAPPSLHAEVEAKLASLLQ